MSAHAVLHIVGFLCVFYWVSGFIFFRTHTSGGSVLMTHAARTPINRCMAAFYRPWFIFCFGVAFRDDPVVWDVAFHDMYPAPEIRGSSSRLTLYLGMLTDSPSSTVWVQPEVAILYGPKVYISGYLTKHRGRTNTFDIWIHKGDDAGSPAAFWMDPDGSTVPVPITP